MRVRVSAHSTIDVPFLFSASRAFPVRGTREIEVLEQQEDPPAIVVKVKNHTTGAMQDESRPDPDRMGLASYALLLADNRLSIHEAGSIDAAVSGAEVAAARVEVARLAALHLDLKGENARLEAERDRALARVAELETVAAGNGKKKADKTE